MVATSPLTPAQMEAELARVAEGFRTLQRVTSTPYPIAQSPKEIIWTLNKAKLYRYVPVVPPEQRYPVPLLLVFALMNRSSILDLRPGNSFVEYMVGKGYDVYLLDWGSPGPEDRNLRFDDYALDYLPRAIRKVKSTSGSAEFSMLGWCMGAILTSLYASLRPDDGLKNLIVLTAPLDFTDPTCGSFMRWIDDKYFDVDKLVATLGNMPGDMLDYGAKALKPVENWIGSYLRLWDNIDNPKIVESWHAMNTWVSDLIPMTGAAYSQLIKDFFRGNKLMQGTLQIRGEWVDLANIRASFLNMVANEDHIVPPGQTVGVMDKIGSGDKELMRVPGGHIGMMAGSAAQKGTWPKLEGWLGARSGERGTA